MTGLGSRRGQLAVRLESWIDFTFTQPASLRRRIKRGTGAMTSTENHDGALERPERARHHDEAWELELAEQAHAAREAEGAEDPHGLHHYLRSLAKRFGGQTPPQLLQPMLHVHGKYLAHRYKRIRRAVERMTRPGSTRQKVAVHCAQHETAWRVALRAACESREQILEEFDESVRYWSWVQSHRRLPSRWAFRLARFNSRRVDHPWQSITPQTLALLAELEAEMSRQSMEITSPRRRYSIVDS